MDCSTNDFVNEAKVLADIKFWQTITDLNILKINFEFWGYQKVFGSQRKKTQQKVDFGDTSEVDFMDKITIDRHDNLRASEISTPNLVNEVYHNTHGDSINGSDIELYRCFNDFYNKNCMSEGIIFKRSLIKNQLDEISEIDRPNFTNNNIALMSNGVNIQYGTTTKSECNKITEFEKLGITNNKKMLYYIDMIKDINRQLILNNSLQSFFNINIVGQNLNLQKSHSKNFISNNDNNEQNQPNFIDVFSISKKEKMPEIPNKKTEIKSVINLIDSNSKSTYDKNLMKNFCTLSRRYNISNLIRSSAYLKQRKNLPKRKVSGCARPSDYSVLQDNDNDSTYAKTIQKRVYLPVSLEKLISTEGQTARQTIEQKTDFKQNSSFAQSHKKILDFMMDSTPPRVGSFNPEHCRSNYHSNRSENQFQNLLKVFLENSSQQFSKTPRTD